MKICVYAIAKNESKFVSRWYESVKEADYVCVLDTGSVDNTYDELKKLGVIVEQKTYKNFRFDLARNDSMKLIPEDTDICVSVDLDEFFEPGWSKTLKENWTDTTGRARYRYTWNFNPDGSEGVVFMADKVHKYGKFRWKYPVHEVLTCDDNDYSYTTLDLPQIQLNHRADNTKSRANYLPLLIQSVKENPYDDRNVHYLGREYMFHGEYKKAIDTLNRHLNLPTSTWGVERCASLRYIANCHRLLGHKKKEEECLLKAIIEANNVREPYFELALHYYSNKQFLKASVTLLEMLNITHRELNYISSPICWGALPYDYLSLALYELGEYKKAISYVDEAIKLSPLDTRLKTNRNIFVEKLLTQENSNRP